MSYEAPLRGDVQLPPQIIRFTDMKDFCNRIFPPALLQTIGTDLEFFRSRAILCFRNDTVSEINADLLNLLGGETRIYHSVDRTDIDDAENGRAPLPQEFLRSLEPASLPPARLCLKVGAPIMLLRNLYPAEGLCNGTRLLVTRLGERCI